MNELPLATPLVAETPRVARGGEVGEPAGELPVSGIGELTSSQERAVRGDMLAAAEVADADVDRPPEEVLLYAALSHEKPAGLAGGASGLDGSPARGSGSLYSPGATSFGASG